MKFVIIFSLNLGFVSEVGCACVSKEDMGNMLSHSECVLCEHRILANSRCVGLSETQISIREAGQACS